MSVEVGDKVQIKAGGMDVTNGYKAKAGKLYGEGGPLFGKVVKIVENWNTGGKFGLPKTVTKVRISELNSSTIVWQVRPEDVAENKVVEEPVKEPEPEPAPEPKPEPVPIPEPDPVSYAGAEIFPSSGPYAPQKGLEDWSIGSSSQAGITDSFYYETTLRGRATTAQSRVDETNGATIRNRIPSRRMSFNEIGAPHIEEYELIKNTKPLHISNDGFVREILDDNETIIQNQYKFPQKISSGDINGMNLAQYDYQFIPGDTRYDGPATSMEDKLQELRAAVGLPVHGDRDKARSMKFYMYNRFKTPDINLAPTKLFTHIFFTRPDLYLLDGPNSIATQAKNHTDSALMWRQYPELFKLLTDRSRCNDDNNFNMLLSNQVMSFHLNDEKLNVREAGSNWVKQPIMYGDSWSGRGPDTFDCQFLETSELSVINLIKLWITYIDNVSSGVWSPNYGNKCHVFDRALDYAASVYVFKVGEDGEEVKYWSKYYGVFPINTGVSSLSWDNGEDPGKAINPTIEFQYSRKKDRSPITLLEFNDVASIQGTQEWIPAYNPNMNHTDHPYVGTPYIEIDLKDPELRTNDISTGERTIIRLKYKKDDNYFRSDKQLFRAIS